MAIHTPGKRNRRNRQGSSKRNVVAALSLTAMVDMFTVLVVFLLQNYNMTGEIIEIPDEVVLPQATAVKELKPSNVVVITEEKILLNDERVYDKEYVREQEDWLLPELKDHVQKLIATGEKEKAKLSNKVKRAVNPEDEEGEKYKLDSFRKMTIQADESIEFLTVKKVMYTLTEAGIHEINFAVVKKESETEEL